MLIILSEKNFRKNHKFWSKIAFFRFLWKKGLTTFSSRVQPSWDLSQTEEQILSFLKLYGISCGKLWKKSYGVLKSDHFFKRASFQNFYSFFWFDDSYVPLQYKNKPQLQKNKPHIITDDNENPTFTTGAKFVIIT